MVYDGCGFCYYGYVVLIMTRWYASVNYGLEKPISKIIKSYGAKGIEVMDSALIFDCQNEIKVNCINNLFVILASYHAENILEAAKKAVKKQYKIPRLKGKTFRVVVMDNGKLRSIPANVMSELEKSIARRTGLSTNRANPDIEIWLNRRNNNAVYFMVRTKKHASFDKKLKKGELRPDIVAVMMHEAKVNGDMIIADLFGGWGAIAAGITRYKEIHTGDINDECVRYQKKRLGKKRDCYVYKWNAHKLPFEDMSVDAVITDPPWGEYESIDIAQFYDDTVREVARILRRQGVFVFLSSAYDEVKCSLDRYGFSYFVVSLKISGKDTCLFCAERGG